jgi:hypothetical protein
MLGKWLHNAITAQSQHNRDGQPVLSLATEVQPFYDQRKSEFLVGSRTHQLSRPPWASTTEQRPCRVTPIIYEHYPDKPSVLIVGPAASSSPPAVRTFPVLGT